MQTTSHNSNQQTTWGEDVVIEHREEIPEIVQYLNNTIDQLQPLRYEIGKVFDTEETFKNLINDLPNGSVKGQKEYFIEDIIRLGKLFFESKKNTKMNIQIEIVKTNMCRLFHADCYRQRLLCTYMGPGTQWLDNSNVNRKALGKGSNAHIVKDFNKINQAKAFEVILLKGKKYGGDELGIVHRSPPIEQESKTRVLLKIDE